MLVVSPEGVSGALRAKCRPWRALQTGENPSELQETCQRKATAR